jgi:putative transposase
MDEEHLRCAIRYIALNPVRARLVDRTEDWPWSSVHVHLGRAADDGLTTEEPVRLRCPDFAHLLAAGEDAEMAARLRKAETIGRPIGSKAFLEQLEKGCGRSLAPRKRGRRPRELELN